MRGRRRRGYAGPGKRRRQECVIGDASGKAGAETGAVTMTRVVVSRREWMVATGSERSVLAGLELV